MTLSIIDTYHNNALHSAVGRYAECCILLFVMLSVIMLNVFMLSVVVPRRKLSWQKHSSLLSLTISGDEKSFRALNNRRSTLVTFWHEFTYSFEKPYLYTTQR